ncbi:caspase family protein [Nucisporomicrobium flavum]|uniref:caspase family protein n=1 Tax=Nucisporomicrobium flavum TaxID=2785915 RepID=UPI003C2B8142
MTDDAVWLRRPSGGGATHALVIGVSDYPYRPFGLGHLPGAATSARLFAEWLSEEYRSPDAPLGSVRLLVAPSAREKLDAAGTPRPTRDNVMEALDAWHADCFTSAANVAILYVCGHGLLESTDGGVVFMSDAGRLRTQRLDAALDIAGVRAGMAGPGSPDRQWYFADACRERSAELDDFAEVLRGGISLPARRGPHASHRPIFFAAPPSRSAYQSGQGSIFLRALLQSLRLNALEPPAGPDSRWAVTTNSLLTALTTEVERLAKKHGVRQRVTIGGTFLPREILVHSDEPPQVPVSLVVTPAEAETVGSGGAEIFDGRTNVRVLPRSGLPIHRVPVPGGLWTLDVTFDPPHPSYRDLRSVALQIRPPMCEEPVDLS